MGVHDLWLFVIAGLLLNITPGPDMALIIARSTQQGARAGAAAALGVGAGALVHIGAAAIGLSAILVTSSLAFTVLKWIGALYLIYLGVQTLRSSFQDARTAATAQSAPPLSLRHIFVQGILTNALNPKVAVFFLAFLPQFVDADAPSKVMAFVMLGLMFNVVGTAWNLLVAVLAGWLATSRAYRRLKTWLDRTIGTMFIAVGCKLALSERP